ncbi:hypothetical protein SAMN04488505_102231 [Chitinophaga rupis]|uniref:NACHT domain-containing protein n=1 Tax=Chitinophaga rupis TaxID=573321 RepID=A0A1H7Q2M3_9BACT|nr:hypothetical protein [Chitinophaga rupis]SEL42059.1 hypothetical protein SAMN04488505_102231 [Chitinophaga rupis]
MEEISRLLSEYINPLLHDAGQYWLEKHSLLLLTLVFVVLLPGLHKLIIFLLERRKKGILRRNLYPFFDAAEIVNATKYYVETRFQNIDPANEQETRLANVFSAKQKIIPFLIKKSFNSDDSQKYFMVLADSGMGKTTMLINLYYTYLRQIGRRFEIKLLPLGSKDLDSTLLSINQTDKQKKILLLDGFDEDPKAVEDYRKRMNELLDLTSEFRKVIITSRTQFFESAIEEPYETGQMKFGGDKGMHFFYKMYVSPFDDKNVSDYLNKKYGFFNKRKKRVAKGIVEQCPNLMVRPMLLAYIDNLVTENQTYKYSYELYDTLITKWLDRESSRVPVCSKGKFKADLRLFSRAVAIDIYYNQKERNGLFINSEELSELARKFDIDLTIIDLKSKSLLNRNASGQYKFSHKSILEYFLSLEIFENENFRNTFNYESMSQAKAFHSEMCHAIVSREQHRVNFDIPYETTTYSNLVVYLKKYLPVCPIQGIEINRSLTILNPHEFSNNFFWGLRNIFFINILITQKSDIEKLLLLPNLKGICILNDCSQFRSHFMDIRMEQNENKLQLFADDFKHLISRINSDRTVSGLQGFVEKREPNVHNIFGRPHETSKKLYDIYISTLFVCVKAKIKQSRPDITFYSDPIDENGKTISVF